MSVLEELKNAFLPILEENVIQEAYRQALRQQNDNENNDGVSSSAADILLAKLEEREKEPTEVVSIRSVDSNNININHLSTESSVNLSHHLRQLELIRLFPSWDADVLQSAFRENHYDFDATVSSLTDAFGEALEAEAEPQPTLPTIPVLVRPTNLLPKRTTEKFKTNLNNSTKKKVTRVPIVIDPRLSVYRSVSCVAPEYVEEISILYQNRSKLLSLSHDAVARGDFEASKELLKSSQELANTITITRNNMIEKMCEPFSNSKSKSKSKSVSSNYDNESNNYDCYRLDLHGIGTEDAVLIVQHHIKQLYTAATKNNYNDSNSIDNYSFFVVLIVITGRGKHSPNSNSNNKNSKQSKNNKSRIRHAVHQLLNQQFNNESNGNNNDWIQWDLQDEGSITITMTIKS